MARRWDSQADAVSETGAGQRDSAWIGDHRFGYGRATVRMPVERRKEAGGPVARTARPRAFTLPSATPQGLRSSGSAETAECRYCFTYQYVASSAVGRIAAVVPRFPPLVSPM